MNGDLPESVIRASAQETLLTRWWLAAAVAALAAVLTAITIVRAQRATGSDVTPRPRRGRWRRRGCVLTCGLAWTIAGLLGVNSWYNMVPDLTGAERQIESLLGLPISYRTLHGGHVRVVTLPAIPDLHVSASDAWVYTPPGYDPSGSTRYPVVYLLHGYPGTSADWFTLGHADLLLDALIRTHTIPPVIAVAPDVNGDDGIRDGECLDADGGPQVETWLYRSLLPYVDDNWPTRPDAHHRLIAGMSMGGYCAIDQGLRHPQAWGGVAAIEGYGDPGAQAASEMGYSRAEFEAVSPSHYIPTMTFAKRVPVYLDAATASGEKRLRDLADKLTARGQPVLFRVDPGLGHTWAAARAGLPHGLASVTRELRW